MERATSADDSSCHRDIPGEHREGTEMNNDLLVNAEIDYRVNRIRDDWRPIRGRRALRRQRREEEAKVAEASTWIG